MNMEWRIPNMKTSDIDNTINMFNLRSRSQKEWGGGNGQECSRINEKLLYSKQRNTHNLNHDE